MGRGNREPEVITGLKSPAHFPDRTGEQPAAGPDPVTLAAQTSELAKPEARTPGEKVYHSRIRQLRIQVKTQQDRLDMATGTLVRGETKYAQFVDGELRTTDPETQAMIERSRSFRSGDVWDADKVRQEAAVASYNTLVEQVLSNPELLAKLRKDERLKKGLDLPDFPLPERGPEVRSSEPAPSA